jgi:hypothetical protein
LSKRASRTLVPEADIARVAYADAPGGMQLLLVAPGIVGRGLVAKAKNAFTRNAAIMLHRVMITK